MTDLSQACDELAAALPRAAALIADPDIDGTTSGGKPGSSPPWNASVAYAVLDALEGVGRLEVDLRGPGAATERRPMAQTGTALEAIARLGHGIDHIDAAEAARRIRSWLTAIEQLPAIDEAERWIRIGAACPYCAMPNSLRVAVRSGRVTCIRLGACADSDGKHPVGQMAVGQVTARAAVHWADGLVAP